jgi:hypothetical protein
MRLLKALLNQSSVYLELEVQGKLCGEKHVLRYKLTLLATITGPEARALIESQETGEGHIFSHDTDKMDKVEIYHEERLH